MKDGLPPWLQALDEADLQFIKRFVLSSGSLKAMCEDYGVSYPTLRARLDRLIAKITTAEDPKISDAFQRKLSILIADGTITAALAKELLKSHRDVLQKEEK